MEYGEACLPEGWKEGEKIGEGAFAVVYRCQDADGVDLPYAAKKYTITNSSTFEDAKNEVNVLEKLSHERVVRYYQVTSRSTITYVIMEYVPGGTLTGRLKSSGAFDEPTTRRYTKQLMDGLNYLHSENVIHRDLKGSNVLLDAKDNIKLSDFGISKILYPEGTLSGAVKDFCGTLRYMSPEMLMEQGYGRRTDVWSLGCVIVEMFSGNSPWSKITKLSEFVIKVTNQEGPEYELPEAVSGTARDLLELCFTWDKDKRPHMEQLLEHEFVREEKKEKRRLCCIVI